MTIKQLGGVFGRNPTFNDVTIEGELTFDGDIDIGSDLKVNGNLEVLGTSTFTDATLPITVNRTGGDGRHVTFEDGGSDRGGIAEHSSDLYFGTPSSGIRVSRFSSFIGPRTVDNGAATLDLGGTGSNQWRNLYLSGNVIPASGSGIDFSATAGTGTSELLDDYEEGVYTPTLGNMSGGTVTYTTQTGIYTKVGRQVTVYFKIVVNTNTNTGGNTTVSVPFTAGTGGFVGPLGLNTSSNSAITHVSFFVGSANANFYTAGGGTLNGSAVVNGSKLQGSITYFV